MTTTDGATTDSATTDSATTDSATTDSATTADVLDARATPEARRAEMARRRAECPIGRLGTGATAPWYLAGYEAVAGVLPEVAHFGGAVGSGDVDDDHRAFNGLPEPEHGRVRRVVNGLVAGHRARQAEPFLRQLSARLADRLAASVPGDGQQNGGDDTGGVDVMAGFVDHLPCAVTAHLLGWPIDDPVQLYRWTVELCDRAMEMRPGTRLTNADLCPPFATYVDERIAERLARPEDDWPDDGLTYLLRAEIDGRRMTPTFVRTQLIFVLGAGSETSRDLIGGLLYDLARDRPLQDRVRADRSLLAPAVEEALRLWSPTQFMVRRCTGAVTVAGHDFAAGDDVLIGLASANRDESVFRDPDEYRLDRPNPRSHVAFGAGPHVCPGAALARAEAVIALGAFLDRFAAFALAPGGYEPLANAMFGGPRVLRLLLTPAAVAARTA
jgi:cytochrome P450